MNTNNNKALHLEFKQTRNRNKDEIITTGPGVSSIFATFVLLFKKTALLKIGKQQSWYVRSVLGQLNEATHMRPFLLATYHPNHEGLSLFDGSCPNMTTAPLHLSRGVFVKPSRSRHQFDKLPV